MEGFWLGRWMDDQSLVSKVRLMRDVSGLIREGVLTSTIANQIALADVPTAINQQTDGKTLIVME